MFFAHFSSELRTFRCAAVSKPLEDEYKEAKPVLQAMATAGMEGDTSKVIVQRKLGVLQGSEYWFG